MKESVREIVDQGYIKMQGGKEYLQVAHRVVWFRNEHPDWAIDTKVVDIQDRPYVQARVMRPVFDKEGNEIGETLVASAYKALPVRS